MACLFCRPLVSLNFIMPAGTKGFASAFILRSVRLPMRGDRASAKKAKRRDHGSPGSAEAHRGKGRAPMGAKAPGASACVEEFARGGARRDRDRSSSRPPRETCTSPAPRPCSLIAAINRNGVQLLGPSDRFSAPLRALAVYQASPPATTDNSRELASVRATASLDRNKAYGSLL